MAISVTRAESGNFPYIYRYLVTTTGGSSTLDGDIDATQTTITLVDSSGFSASGKVRVDEEIITYTGNTGTDLTGCTRKAENSNSDSHTSGATVDEVTTAFSSNLEGSSTLDYFDDAAEVGSCLYFGDNNHYYETYVGAKIYVGTQIAATSITIKWEYRSSSSDTWMELNDLVDNTVGFSVAGENYLYFRGPSDWRRVTINSVGKHWIRARISEVNTLTEGGAQSTQTIKYVSNAISVSGGTEGTPAGFEDVYTAAVTGGWLNIQKYTSGTGGYGVPLYIFNGYILSIASGCVFKDTNKIAVFQPGYISGQSDTTFGTSYWTDHLGKSGCILVFGRFASEGVVPVSGTLNLFGSVLMNNFDSQTTTNFYLTSSMLLSSSSGNFDLSTTNNAVIKDSSFPLIMRNTQLGTGINWQYPNSTIRSIKAWAGAGGLLLRDVNAYSYSISQATTVIFYDCTSLSGTFSLTNDGSSTTPTYIYTHSSLALTITDDTGSAISGALVSIKDQYGNPAQAWVGTLASGSVQNIADKTTDVNGEVDTFDVLHNYYIYVFGGADTNTTYSPFTITISKTGYQTKTMVLTMNKKREEIVVLEKVVKFITAGGDPLLWNLKATDSQNKHNWVKV